MRPPEVRVYLTVVLGMVQTEPDPEVCEKLRNWRPATFKGWLRYANKPLRGSGGKAPMERTQPHCSRVKSPVRLTDET